MDKINIEVLTQEKTLRSNITVDTLNNINKVENFNPKKLNKIREKKREQLLNLYNRYFNRCLELITVYNNQNITDMEYCVPSSLDECRYYNSKDCLDFINMKLLELKFKTYKMSPTKLFITWLFSNF